MVAEDDLLVACELHSPEQLTAALAKGLDARLPLRGQPLLDWLLGMYTRSDRLAACVRVLERHGAPMPTPALAAILLDDVVGLQSALRAEPDSLQRRVSLVSSFTPLHDVSLLHVAAEFGSMAMLEALLAAGAAIDARAGTDAYGLGGHSALFHTVNAHADRAAPLRRRLLLAGADPLLRVHGVVWGRGFDWETTWYDLTPVGYAQLGLLPQMHRCEQQVNATVRELLACAKRVLPPLSNVPNRYLAPRP